MNRVSKAAVLAAAVGVAGCSVGTDARQRTVVIVELSRDTVPLEISDTVILRAEARDANGGAIPDTPITWSTLDPNLADLTVRGGGASARLSAAGAGIAHVTATAAEHSDTVVLRIPPALTSTTLSTHLDTLSAFGDSLEILASSADGLGPRTGRYSITTSNPAAAQVTLNGTTGLIVAVANGSAFVTFTERHGTRDSALVVVAQREAITDLRPDIAGGYVGRTQQLTVTVQDARRHIMPGIAVTFRSLDTTIARVSSTGLLTFLAAGTGAVEARGAGGSVDTSVVAVQPASRIGFRDAADSVGTGLLSSEPVGFDGPDWVSQFAHLSLADTSIASAPDSVLFANFGGSIPIAGKKVGTTTLIATSPLMAPDTLRIVVSQGQLHLGNYDYPYESRTRPLPQGAQAMIMIRAEDARGVVQGPADTIAITMAPRDTTIVKLPGTPQPYILGPPGSGSTLFFVEPRDTGSTWVVASAPGFRADSILFVVTGSPALHFNARPLIIGALQRNTDNASIGTTQGWNHGGDIPITFTRRHPTVATFPDTLTLPSNALYWPTPYAGLVPGIDTIIASAPGYTPDTLVLYVTTPQFLPTPIPVYGTTLDAWLEVFVGDSLGVRHATDGPLLVTGTPLDTTVARARSTRLPAAWDALWPLHFSPVDTGTTTVTLTDSAGRYTPATFPLHIALDPNLHLGVYDGYQVGPPAPRLRFDETRFVLQAPPQAGRVVYLAATNPRVLRTPDSVIVQGAQYTYVAVAAGDTAGTSRVVVSSRGMRTDTSASVEVTPGALHIIAPDSAFVGYSGYNLIIGATRNCANFFGFDTTATFSIRPLDPGVVVPSTATIATGKDCSSPVPISFTTPGDAPIIVEDHRPVPLAYRADTVTIIARFPRFFFAPPRLVTIGVGQIDSVHIVRNGNAQDRISPTLAARTGRASPTGFPTLGTSVWQAGAEVRGVSVGTDTLIVGAPQYDADTLPILVTEGSLSIPTWPDHLIQGGVLRIQLVVQDSAGVRHRAADTTTFSLEPEVGLAFSDLAGKSINSIIVPSGQDTSLPFLVRAVGPAGPGRARFTNLHYMDQVFSLTVIQ